jgi:hypothetical protein
MRHADDQFEPGGVDHHRDERDPDDVDPESVNLMMVLDSIPGAWEAAQQGFADVRAGRGVTLDEL